MIHSYTYIQYSSVFIDIISFMLINSVPYPYACVRVQYKELATDISDRLHD